MLIDFLLVFYSESELSRNLFLVDFGVCFCSLLQAFAHALDFGHESMEISITLLVCSIFLIDSLKGGICLLSHVRSWCLQHLAIIRKWFLDYNDYHSCQLFCSQQGYSNASAWYYIL